jgi:hypothetical protein
MRHQTTLRSEPKAKRRRPRRRTEPPRPRQGPSAASAPTAGGPGRPLRRTRPRAWRRSAGDELEELRRAQDAEGDSRRLDQVLLQLLRPEVAARLQSVCPHDREHDVVPHAGRPKPRRSGAPRHRPGGPRASGSPPQPSFDRKPCIRPSGPAREASLSGGRSSAPRGANCRKSLTSASNFRTSLAASLRGSHSVTACPWAKAC